MCFTLEAKRFFLVVGVDLLAYLTKTPSRLIIIIPLSVTDQCSE